MSLLGKGEEERRVTIPNRRVFAALAQPLHTELPHRLQHDEAGLACSTLLLSQQTLLTEPFQSREDIERISGAAHRLRRRERKAPRKDRQATKEGLLLRREQVIGP